MLDSNISVLMAVHNGENSIKNSIISILNQTKSNFELIVVDDGSIDNTSGVVSSIKDNRIKLIQNERNLGLSKSLNVGIGVARGDFIARMDADDYSYSNRLEEQVNYMIDKKIDICGSLAAIASENKELVWNYPISDSEIRSELLFSTPLIHPSVVIHRKVFDQGYRYNENFDRTQDYELWYRLSKEYKFGNIPKILIRYNLFGNKKSLRGKVHKQILSELVPDYSEKELSVHNRLSRWVPPNTENELIAYESWLEKLYRSVDKGEGSIRKEVGWVFGYRLLYSSFKLHDSIYSTIKYLKKSIFFPYLVRKYPMYKYRDLRNNIILKKLKDE